MKKLERLENLFTPEEWKKLHDDLAEMAKQRRLTEAASRNIPMA